MNEQEFGREGLLIIDALREQIHATPMPHPSRPPTTQPVWTMRAPLARLLAAAAIVLAGAIVAVVLALSAGTNPAPAFAATLRPDRTVTITLHQLQAMNQLNAKLASLGTRIRVIPVLRGCVAPVHTVSNGQIAPEPARTLEASSTGRPLISMTVEVDTVPGRTFVIAVTKSGSVGLSVVVLGPAPSCAGDNPTPTTNPFLLYAHH